MKKLNSFISMSIMLLAALILITGCKKKSNDPVDPSFTVTYSTVNLQGGGEGVQFFAKCTNEAVIMDKVTITDPASYIITHNYSASSFAENELFPMQDTDIAYEKQSGTWKFNLVGNRSSDGVAFAIDVEITVSK
jgi:hypothetical protein